MDDEPRSPELSERRRRQVDHLEGTGEMTLEEAARLRSTEDPTAFAAALRVVRTRHAQAGLDAAVLAGELGESEAAELLARVRDGEHTASLRARIRRLAPSGATRRHRSQPAADVAAGPDA